MNSGQQLGFLSNVNSSIGGNFFASRCWCTAPNTVIFSLELVSKIASCSSTKKLINKSTGSICCDETDKYEDLWSVLAVLALMVTLGVYYSLCYAHC